MHRKGEWFIGARGDVKLSTNYNSALYHSLVWSSQLRLTIVSFNFSSDGMVSLHYYIDIIIGTLLKAVVIFAECLFEGESHVV